MIAATPIHTPVSVAPPVAVEVRSTASIRIEHQATANREAWDQAPKQSRREIIVHDKSGQILRVRIVEYE
jgi:hypothetical protein